MQGIAFAALAAGLMQYDLKDLPGSSSFKTAFTVTLLLPEGKK